MHDRIQLHSLLYCPKIDAGATLEPSINLWIEYIIRFSHLVAGIYWIGSSFYFIWLDSSFESPSTPRKNVEGELFMVHGGFYYQVEKRKIFPGELPKVLHWFKWEATLTWITGFLLLIVLYYLKGASLLTSNEIYPMSQAKAVLFSVGILALSWLIYDFIWLPRFEKFKPISTLISVFFFAGLIFLNTKIFSGRGAFIQTGAILGTMMILNVWVRILPGLRKMIQAAEAGQIPDYSASLKSKTRSVHNTYFIFPVLFIMLSNHYPQLYNHPQNALLLIMLSIAGALVRHAMVTKRPVERFTLFPAAILLGALIFKTSADNQLVQGTAAFAQVQPIFQARCITCHSRNPSDDIFKVAPKNLLLETEAEITAAADKIYEQVIVTRVMPLGNKTQITDDERLLLTKWYLGLQKH